MRTATRISIAALLIVGCSPAAPGAGGPSGPPATGPTSPPATTAVSAAPTSGPADVTTQIEEILGAQFNGSALVTHDGQVVYSAGLGMADATKSTANTPHTRFRLGSITKQFTAMAILLLEADGELSETDPVCRYLDSCPKGWASIAIRHLLAHQSGIANFTDQPGFDPAQSATPAQTIASVAGIPLAWTPGEAFGYSNTGYSLLGLVIERASGMSYEAFLQQRIFDPLAMSDSGYDHDGSGLAVGYSSGFTLADPIDMSVPYAGGGLYSTVLDMERWDKALDGESLVSTSMIERFFTPIATTTDRVDMGYAHGVYVGRERGRLLQAHDGGINGFYTHFGRYPDDHLSVVLLTNREEGPDLGILARLIADAVLATTSVP